jgi:hypothetical protein
MGHAIEEQHINFMLRCYERSFNVARSFIVLRPSRYETTTFRVYGQ